jgi:hypothetical protein
MNENDIVLRGPNGEEIVVKQPYTAHDDRGNLIAERYIKNYLAANGDDFIKAQGAALAALSSDVMAYVAKKRQ